MTDKTVDNVAEPPQFYAVKWHCGGEMFYAGNMLVVEKDRYNALRTRASQIIAANKAEIARLNEWKDAVGGLVSSLRKLPTFDHEWGGDKNGWGFVFEWIKWVQNRAESAESRLAVVEAALETLLAKCPNCGGTGMVETGRIQFGYPSDSPCGLCSNERKVFDAALQGVKK